MHNSQKAKTLTIDSAYAITGKIIAKCLRGKNMEKKLAEVIRQDK